MEHHIGRYGFSFPAARPTGGGFVTVLQSHESPPEVVVVDRGGERVVATFGHAGTDYIRDISGIEERLRWSAPDGLEIQGYLVSPNRPGPHPLIAWIHGGPVWAHQPSWPGELTSLLVSRGFALLLPNPRGSSGRGREFAELVYGDPGGAEATDTLSGIDALVERRVADPDRGGGDGREPRRQPIPYAVANDRAVSLKGIGQPVRVVSIDWRA